MDIEEGDLIDDRSSTDGGYQRRNSVSPLPQIRASSENQVAIRKDHSDQDQVDSPQTSARNTVRRNNVRSQCRVETQDGTDICVGCLAAALNKNQRNLEHNNAVDDEESDVCANSPHGSTSLPATLKKYKGNHSTGSCRGMNPTDNPRDENRSNGAHRNKQHCKEIPDTQSRLPFKFYKTDRGQVRKVRTPLQNLLPQSISAPVDNESSLHVCIHEDPAPLTDPPSSMVKQAKIETEEAAQMQRNQYQTNAKRRCSLSRNSSCSSAEHKSVVTCEDLKLAIDYSNDEDISDETEPNSDNDLIVRRSTRDEEKEIRKK
ncbi:hypothetical protein ZHAS_00015905 [Anopheles sinensis]|uniref:Uncharacterized protein n=1 Tax=Anopheles sinensis TaxID=74873 RepID=A0A084WC87_ANOSI|nr:hypothetical protein ZHAS_00015905 [Anopheles sinensis]